MGQSDLNTAGEGVCTETTTTMKTRRTIGQSCTLLRHFQVQSASDYDRATNEAFRAHGRSLKQQKRNMEKRKRRQQAKQHQHDRTIGINTLNVRGLATDVQTLGRKLQGLKEQHGRGNRDVIFLQETHLHTQEHGIAAGHHAAMWGFKREQADHLSFWASGEGRRAVVAILINPYVAVSNMQPWLPQQWTEHLIMTTGEFAGQTLLFINVYAPVNGAARVKFFGQLSQLTLPPDADIVFGGDFNCVLDTQVHRVGETSRPELGATQLRSFLETNGLYDAGYHNLPELNERQAHQTYANQHHTHFHVSAAGPQGSSRLDRFYISATAKHLVRGVETEEALCRTDHRAVLLELHTPRGVIRVKRRPKLYPPPSYVYAAMKSLVEELKAAQGSDSVAMWDRFKRQLLEQMKQLKRQARGRMTRGFRQRIKRIKQQFKKCTQAGEAESGARQCLLEALHQTQDSQRLLKRRTAIRRNAWSPTATTKAFFRRISTKFGDGTIPTLRPTNTAIKRHIHDKANILKDSREATFNGQADAVTDIEAFIGTYAKTWEKVDLSDIDDDITEDKVRAAIAACKIGKACGPDELSNEWYKDNVDRLVPVLTRIYNDCMEHGDTPSSFLEAYIHSIRKGGDTANPLNYRPIALLNTDYNFFTRIIAWRVRRHITRLVSSRQCGFVPGRTIHEVVDLFEAAKAQCSSDEELSQAQVLMLDFAKAYDSLDRDFLLAMLAAKGFPPKFCHMIRTIHTGTIVKFLANGSVSGELKVTSEIRQGCPLAPLLFIIAVDLLYDVVEAEKSIVGIGLTSAAGCRPLTVAGYADDTAIYIANANMQLAALRAVRSFSDVSGLRLNVKISVAINLGNVDHATVPVATGGQEAVTTVSSTRYLGHIAGNADTSKEAWSRAMDSLRIRLVLAEAKTNTAQQRGQTAAAIILPKLLYVARHAWPTEEVVRKAQRCIRNYV